MGLRPPAAFTPVPRRSSRAARQAILGLALLLGAAASAVDSIRCQLADGFDYPVGKPDAAGYYKSRGFWPNGHLGEDWNGRGGGDSDLGDPIYATARGVVVLSENIGVGWGNCVIVRHAFRDATGRIDMVDSLYGHLHERKVKVHQLVERGQLVGTMGSNNGQYFVHLHFEIRKNLKIGMNRSQFARDYSNYYSPTQFIQARRTLQASFQKYDIPVNTFAAYGKSLADMDTTSSGRGISIPVFSGATSITAPTGGVKTPSERPAATNQPRAAPADDSGDFWTRLKAKLKGGKVVDGDPASAR